MSKQASRDSFDLKRLYWAPLIAADASLSAQSARCDRLLARKSDQSRDAAQRQFI